MLYGTEDVPTAEKVVHLHYFVKDCDWWLVEYNPAERLALGYACLGHPMMAEWGYVSLPELAELFQEARLELDTGARSGRILPRLIVERDLHWTPTPAKDCDLPGRW